MSTAAFTSRDDTPPRVSVVVPALNARATIGACLAALERQTMPRQQYEVMVVDDGSRDGTADLARAQGARVVRLEHTSGPGAARNAGIRAARGALVVFTDSDCEPCEDFLEQLVQPLEDDPVVGATKGTYLTRQRPLVARFVQLEYEERYRHTRRHRWIDFVDTYAACFRREDLLRVGGFDTRLRQCQDQELSFRMAAAGIKIRFVDNARTYHRHADRVSVYLRKKYRIARWKVDVLRQHPQKIVSDSHTPQGLKLEIAAAFAALGAAVAALAAWLTAPAPAWSVALAGTTAGAASAAFLALVSPFTARAFRRDPAVGLAAPMLLFMRALVLGAGLVAGLARSAHFAPEQETGHAYRHP